MVSIVTAKTGGAVLSECLGLALTCNTPATRLMKKRLCARDPKRAIEAEKSDG